MPMIDVTAPAGTFRGTKRLAQWGIRDPSGLNRLVGITQPGRVTAVTTTPCSPPAGGLPDGLPPARRANPRLADVGPGLLPIPARGVSAGPEPKTVQPGA